MNHFYDYAVIGGDMRQRYIVKELAEHGNHVCHYAICASAEKDSISTVTTAASLSEACHAICVICPIPLCKNGGFLNQSAFDEPIPIDSILASLKSGQFFFAGCIPEDFRFKATKAGVKVYDLMQNLPLSYFNSVATAEGAICEAITRSPKNLRHSHCAVLGYGKCGQTICQSLKGMLCHTYVVTNNEKELAQAALIADKTGTLSDFATCIEHFDFIFNTIPATVITSDLLNKMNCFATIIDIASAPGGVDYPTAKKLGIHAVLCPGLPGKYAPYSSAKAITETIESILKE
ncbi:MAG: dipicolinate synthase subunit DpsA [Lachnospiraceae bacterium]|nr:dipicolinate synthase subunit DpsA [Lachnospiraceae bacterium]